MEQKAPVTFTIGGKERVLRYSLGAAKRLKKHFGASLFKGIENVDEDKLSILIYEGLKADDPGLTVEIVEEMIDVQELPEIILGVFAALGYSNSAKNEDPATETQTEKPESSTSTTSGQLDATISG